MKITIVSLEDWVGLYKNEELVIENHSLRPNEVLNALGIEYEAEYIEDWPEDLDSLPHKLEDLELV